MAYFSSAKEIKIQGQDVRFVEANNYNEYFVNYVAKEPDKQVLKKLKKFATVKAIPDFQEQIDDLPRALSQPPPSFKQITQWFQAECWERKRPVYWHKESGRIGEATVMRRLLNEWVSADCLAGGFYFTLDQPFKPRESTLVPTIAYQLVQNFPGLGFYVKQAIDKDPLIFSRCCNHQFSKLVVQPLRCLAANDKRERSTQLHSTKVFVLSDKYGCLGYENIRKKAELLEETLRNLDLPVVFFVLSPPPSKYRNLIAPELFQFAAFVLVRMRTWATNSRCGLLCSVIFLTLLMFGIRKFADHVTFMAYPLENGCRSTATCASHQCLLVLWAALLYFTTL